MEPLRFVDPTQRGRPKLTEGERDRLRQVMQAQAQLEGYDQLTELCRIGEPEMANRLAMQHPEWGYAIQFGVVVVDPSLQDQVRLERYEQLMELCGAGELDIAIRLVTQHPEWGYYIKKGLVIADPE